MKVIGLDNDGCLICREGDEVWNCGETPEDFGLDLLTPGEIDTINRELERLAYEQHEQAEVP